MRVLYVNDTHNVPGGAEGLLTRQISVLGQKGVEASVACIPDSATEAMLGRNNIPTIPVAGLRSNPLLATRELERIISKQSFELIHTGSLLGNFSGRRAGRRSRIAVVTTVHCEPDAFLLTDASLYRRLNWRLRWALEQMTIGYADRLIAVSENVARKLAALGVEAEKIEVIPNGINVAETRKYGSQETQTDLSPGRRQVGLVARLEAVKGIDYLIQAVGMLASKIPDIALIILGDGSQKDALARAARNLGIEDRVVFAGYTENPLPYIAELVVFALPSLSEGLNVTLLEAMALKRPVVATDVGGNPEVIKPGTGLLVPPRDPTALADAIAKLINDPTLASKLGTAAAETVEERFSEKHMCDRLLEVYKSAIGKGARKTAARNHP